MQIVVLDGYTENPGDLSWEGFERHGSLTVYDQTPVADTAEIIRRIGNAEIVITNKTPLGEAVFAACPSIRYVGILATGYNIIDLAAAKNRGIPVTNIPAYGTDAVAQFAIALLLEICHHIGHHSDEVHAGRWGRSGHFCFWDHPLIELSGKTMGIVGYGRIGRQTGKVAAAMGMHVVAHEPSPQGEPEAGVRLVGLDELYAASDIISLHCPLFPENTRMINAASIAKMKDGVIFINNSRGALVDEADLAAALDSGKVAAAGLDVVTTEPIPAASPLLTAKNCIITPHISWASFESRARLMDMAVENFEAFLNGTPRNVVNG